MLGEAREHVGELCLRFDVVHLGRRDQADDRCLPLAAAVGTGDQPGLPAQGYSSEGPFCGVVGEADAPVGQETGEGIPALQHVVDSLGDVAAAGQLGAMLDLDGMESVDQRPAPCTSNLEPLIGGEAIDLPLDLEQRVDTAHDVERDRRYHRRDLALRLRIASRRRLDVRDLAPGNVLVLNWSSSTGDGRCARAGSAKSRSSGF